MASLSYNQLARMSPEKLKGLKEREKERKEHEKHEIEKDSYTSNEVTALKVHDRFSCYLATILARDKEVVAVWFRILQGHCEIYFDWLDKDVEYIDNITKYLKNISKNAPTISKDAESDFFGAVVSYCYTKLKFRSDKLENYIKNNVNSKHTKSYRDFFSAQVDDTDKTNLIMISIVCNEYYKKVKYESSIPPKFLGHIKKVGSYGESIKGIIECARRIQYKSLFSNIKVVYGSPVIINNQPIYSWKYTIRSLIDEDKYKRFMDRCSKKPEVMERINKVYTNNVTQQQQHRDIDGIYLHAEMNILALIIDMKINSRVFITVSKRCCYLCELYIDFARKQGYNIIVSEKNQKICKNLNRIIVEKLDHYTADSDSGGVSLDPYDEIGEYMKEYAKKHIHRFEKGISEKSVMAEMRVYSIN
ncbi:hypothetical protein C1646_771687 [Rhizophagus diaphanus]|nr:hypothetical protein C1646_771687 [Rhizophagus diaphanus] [Rhizophagus sp. MUCL 43196]